MTEDVAMIQDKYVDDLEHARVHLRDARRAAAKILAVGKKTTGALESLVKLQAGIDAIARAIEDERKLPDVTKRSTKGSEPAPKERYAEEEDE
jgi:hypothetical protein